MTQVFKILLIRREVTRRALLDRAIGRATEYPFEYDQTMTAELFQETFSPENLARLAKLRQLGHVDLATAARAFNYPNVDSWLDGLMNLRLFNVLRFHPLPTGEPGVEVPFDTISVNLDIG